MNKKRKEKFVKQNDWKVFYIVEIC